MVNRQRMVENFLTMVAIPGISRQEGAMAEAVRAQLTALGIDCVMDDAGAQIGGEVGNLIAKVPGTIDGPPLMLNAHLDTVVSPAPITPVVEVDCIRASGGGILSADDKAGIAIIFEVLRVLQDDRVPHLPLEVVFTVAEEIGLYGAQHLDYSLLQARVGFALDGGRAPNRVMIQAPAQVGMTARIHGRAAHAGARPEKGINAIAIASQAISQMKLGRIDEETTANIGTIHGGTAGNIVPELVEVVGEARSHDEGKLDRQVADMVARFHEAAAAAAGTADVEILHRFPRFKLEPESPALRIVSCAARQIGAVPEYQVTGGCSDANIFNSHGISAAILSAGAENPHSSEERLWLDDFEQAAHMVLAIVACAREILRTP
jgi:tripeptide aminopeptidase